MNSSALLISILILSLASGCAPKSNDDKPQGVLSEAQKKTLEDAKKTEELLKEANERRMKAVDEEK